MLRKILIANRGEIARRVIRACQALGIKTVAVYSVADRDALHVQESDEAHLIGLSPPSESYLRGNAIINVARKAHCEAIHPGYGFLSENAQFAQAVEEAGLVFIGPTAASIKLLGDKLAARKLAQSLDVPAVPGSEKLSDTQAARRAAEQIGYPVLVKAAAGGGGKGMRVVQSAAELPSALERAMSEAQSAFGDPSVFLEKFVPHAKHIEVQVLADSQGNVAHLHERECSVQRRHQKLIEESPSPLLTESERAALCDAAVKLARAANYRSAGTVEFLYDFDAKKFYFLEVNTRVQVEHPITEMRTGVDIVQEQLRIASGEKLSFAQSDVRPKGHAIELRICVEDPENQFLPSLGIIEELQIPSGPGVRVDHALRRGDRITPYYDPLIAKLIVWAENRDAAISRAIEALDGFFILGVRTTMSFHRRALQNSVFRSGAYFTDFIERERLALPAPRDVLVRLAVAAVLRELQSFSSLASAERWVAALGDYELELAVKPGNPATTVRWDDQERLVQLRSGRGSKLYTLCLGDQQFQLAMMKQNSSYIIQWQGHAWSVALERSVARHYRALLRKAAPASAGLALQSVTSHMPGLLLKVAVSEGQRIEVSQSLFVLEAMKMENEIKAPIAGIVDKIHIQPKEQVEKGQLLCTIRTQ